MKCNILLLFSIILIPLGHADTEKWTVHDVYKKRHWKIISYTHDSQGYSILMKQIRHYLIEPVGTNTEQYKVNYKFCDVYRYKVNKDNPHYDLTNQFFSKFGKKGTIEIPSEFLSSMKLIDPHFENFMREMLGKKKEKIHFQQLTKKEWTYKPKPKDGTKIWFMKSIKKYPNFYQITWGSNSQTEKINNTYIFELSEKYFFLERFLKDIPQKNFVKNFWHATEDPDYGFLLFLISHMKIKHKDIDYGGWNHIFNETVLVCIDEKKYPIVNEYRKWFKNKFPMKFEAIDEYLFLGCYFERRNHFTLKYGRFLDTSFSTSTSNDQPRYTATKKLIDRGKQNKVKTYFIEDNEITDELQTLYR